MYVCVHSYMYICICLYIHIWILSIRFFFASLLRRLCVDNDSSESEGVKYMRGAIIEKLFGEVELRSVYIFMNGI